MFKFVTVLPKQTLRTCKSSYSEHVNFVIRLSDSVLYQLFENCLVEFKRENDGGSRVTIRRIAATLADSLNFRYLSRALLCKYKTLSINC